MKSSRVFIIIFVFGIFLLVSAWWHTKDKHLEASTPSVITTNFLPAFSYDDVGPANINEIDTPCGGASELIRTFNVTDDFTIDAVSVNFNADHTYRGDIQVRLQSPAGTTITLINRRYDPDDNYDIALSDDYVNPIDNNMIDNTALPYYERKVVPYNAFGAFAGENSVGTWSLFICDYGYGSGGYSTIYGAYNRSQLLLAGNGLKSTLVDTLVADADGDGVASPGDTIRYTATITNPSGNGTETNMTFVVEPDVNSTLVVGSVMPALGTVITGNVAGDTMVGVNIGTVPDGATVTMTYDIIINAPFPVGVTSLSTQGILNSNAVTDRLTDNPADITSRNDPTVTSVTATTLGGRVWNDMDRDGTLSGTETIYAGVTIDIYVDSDGSGTVTAGDALLATQTTDALGIYSTGWGNFLQFVIDVTDTGGVLTGHPLISGSDPVALTLAGGSINTNINFGYQFPQSITIVKEASPADGTDFQFETNKWGNAYTYLSQWGESGFGDGQFSDPLQIAQDSAGNIYVTDPSGYPRVTKFDSNGTYLLHWGSYGRGDGQFIVPRGIAVDRWDRVYVLDSNQPSIQVFDTNGVFINRWGSYGGSNGQFNNPAGVALDSNGFVYVADSYNHRIQKFDNLGNFITTWGNRGTSLGQFRYPFGLAIDANDNVYVTDGSNRRIQKFDSDGDFILSWGVSGDLDDGIDVDYAGNIYLSDASNHNIRKFNPNGLLVTQWGSYGTGTGEFFRPRDVMVDKRGNVYVLDAGNDRVQKFGAPGIIPASFSLDDVTVDDGDSFADTIRFAGIPTDTYVFTEIAQSKWGLNNLRCVTDDMGDSPIISGSTVTITLDQGEDVTCTYQNNISTITLIKEAIPADGTDFTFRTTANYLHLGEWGTAGNSAGQFNEPRHIAIDANRDVYVADMYNHRIQKFNDQGDYILQWGSFGNGDGQFNYPTGVAVNNAGNIFVVDSGNHRIQQFDSSGTYIRQWGSYGNGNGQFDVPYSIAVDSAGNLYVGDTFNHRIQKFNSSGTYLTQWGGFGNGDGQFNRPYGIAADNAGNLYVADTFNHRVQHFNTTGSYLNQWGGFGNGDGQLNRPYGIGVDNASTIYVVDSYNHRFQSFNSNGDYLYQWGSLGSNINQFDLPRGVAIDHRGHIFITDDNNHRVQKFEPPLVPALFTLDDAAVDDSDGISQTVRFTGMRANTYIFTEETLMGWGVDMIDCVTTDVSQMPLVSGNQVRIEMDDGEDVTCTFHNQINTPPTATDDLYVSTDTTIMVSSVISGVLGNDTDPEGDSLTALLVSDVPTGTLTLGDNGTFTYIPPLGFLGTITFTYQATDGSNLSNVATVTLQITCAQNPSFSVTVCIRLGNDGVYLYWNDNPDVLGGYEVHRSTTPYYTPDVGTYQTTLSSDTLQYTDVGAIGNAGINYYYYIVPLSCGSCTPATSNHVAEFDFAIQPGS